jgi:hypothetical protein
MYSLLNPNLMDIPSSVCSTIPTQAGSLFLDYVWNVQFHHHIQGFKDQEVDLGNTHVQDMFISSTSFIYKLMKIQTKAIADSNRLVSARLSSLEEFIGDTGNDGDGDDASGGTGSSSLNETNMANFIRAASKSR